MSTEINQIIAGSRNIRYKKGDTLKPIVYTFTINSLPIDFTGSTFTLKIFSADSSTESPLVTFSIGAGITLDTTASKVTINHIDALYSLPEGFYEYNLKETDAADRVTTWIEGYFSNSISN